MKKSYFLLALAAAAFYSLGAASATFAATPPPVAKTPAPGKWEIVPHVLVEATRTPLEIRYEQTGEALKPGDAICLSLEKLSVASLFHLPISEGMELAPWKGALPKIDFDSGKVNGVGYREVIFKFPQGLKKGESFKLLFGNKQPDGKIIALVTPLPMTNFGLPTWTIPAGAKGRARWIDWFDAGWYDAVAHCDIIPDKAKEVLIYLPSLVKVGQPFFMRASVTDGFDSRPEPVWTGRLEVEKNASVKNLPASVDYSGDDKCYKVIRNLSIDREGVYRVRMKGPDGRWYESNPVVVRKEIDAPIYWGDIHNHGQYSEGTAMSNEWFYETARTVTGMDYVALSDHMAAIPTARDVDKGRLYKWRNGHIMNPYDAWKNTIEVANSSGVKGEFVPLLGYENGCKDGGHYNVYYADASMDNMDAMFPKDQSLYVQEIRAPMLSPAAKGKDVLCFPHCHASSFDWTLIEERTLNGVGKRLTPVVEVYSDWGAIYPFFDPKIVNSKFGGPRNATTKNVLWAWDKGFKFGAVGDADSHTGLPGRIHIVGSSALEHDHPVGMTAVKTNDFTRQGIMNAYQNMAVYATTGDRIFLDFTLDGKSMGKDLATDKPIEGFIQLAGVQKFANAKLYRGVELLKEFKLDSRDTILRFTLDAPTFADEKAYAVYATQVDGAMAMGTPIWVRKYSTPDLAWENRDGKLFLVNNGKAEAKDVTVAHSEDSYAVASPSITGAVPSESVDYSFIWTERRDDQTVIFHHRYKGKEEVNVDVLFKGVTCSIGKEPNLVTDDDFLTNGFYSSGSKMRRTDEGLKLDLKPARIEHFYPGYDIIFKVSGTEPAYVELRFDHPVDTYMWGKPTTASVVRVPLNGLGGVDKPGETVIKKIAPGEKIEMDKKLGYKGYWVADPANTIAESNEGNNMIEVK